MSDANNENGSTESENNESESEVSIDFDELDDEVKEQLATHPQVRKYIEYQKTSLPQIIAMLSNLKESEETEETWDLFTEGVSDRAGRVKQRTVQKVVDAMVAEYEEAEQ